MVTKEFRLKEGSASMEKVYILCISLLLVSIIKAAFTRDRCNLVSFRAVHSGRGMPKLCWVHTGAAPLWDSTVPNGIAFLSGPIWYWIGEPIESGSARYRINVTIIPTNFVPVPNRSSLV